jgi:hypothetical protein
MTKVNIMNKKEPEFEQDNCALFVQLEGMIEELIKLEDWHFMNSVEGHNLHKHVGDKTTSSASSQQNKTRDCIPFQAA